jgi:hypothetical protein
MISIYDVSDKREDLKTLSFVFGDSEIKKSLAEDLNYSENQITIDKSGKEIKEKLKENLMQMAMKRAVMSSKMSECVEKIGIEPKCEFDSYDFRGFEDKFLIIPKKYGWEQMRNEGDKQPMDSNIVVAEQKVEKVSEEVTDKMREYNNHAFKYLHISIDCMILKTILDNIKDNKEFKLKPTIAAKLGF